MKHNFLFLLSAVALLAACGEGSSDNPNKFGVKVQDGVMTGKYNPAGFNSKQIQALLSADCKDKKLSGYGEQPDAEGMIAFTATCAGGASVADSIGQIEVM